MSKVGEAYIGSREQRAFDIAAATVLGAASSPLLLGAAIALGIEQRSPNVLFRQGRIGKDGKPFDIFKLRTIAGQDHSGSNEMGGSDHPLATNLGRIIRKSGIDELPQVVNVLKGDIHMVGIRAQIPLTLEQRHDADPKLFSKWWPWAKINPGLVGPGQKHAHEHVGPYAEDSDFIIEVMELDIKGCEGASLSSNRESFLSLMAGALSLVHANQQEVLPPEEFL